MQLYQIGSQFKICLILVSISSTDFKLILLKRQYANAQICSSTIENCLLPHCYSNELVLGTPIKSFQKRLSITSIGASIKSPLSTSNGLKKIHVIWNEDQITSYVEIHCKLQPENQLG